MFSSFISSDASNAVYSVVGDGLFSPEKTALELVFKNVEASKLQGSTFIQILDQITTKIPNNVYYGAKEGQDFWFHLFKSTWGASSHIETEHYQFPYGNPGNYLSNAIKSVDEKLSFDRMRQPKTKVLLAYSGGKESTLIKHILDSNEVSYDTVSMFDAWQFKNRKSEWESRRYSEQIGISEIAICPTFKSSLLSIPNHQDSDEYLDSFGYSMSFPFVAIQRLALMLYAEANGYDIVLCGDEAERQQVYKVGHLIYPTHDFFQSQWFYNLLNLVSKKAKMYTPLMNFTQYHIIDTLVKLDIPFYSCWKQHNGWCNQCGKCSRIAEMAGNSLTSWESRPKFLTGLNQESKIEDFYKLLGIFDYKEHGGIPYFKNLDKVLEVYLEGRTNNKNVKVKLVTDTFFDVWEAEDLELLEHQYNNWS